MRESLTIILTALLFLAGFTFQGSQADLLIRGGRIHDGTGSESFVADIAIRGDRITFIGNAQTAGITAARTLDAAGLIVAPGFIDPHT
ncbi:MAG: hypothetical protein HY646_01440, partial [Acidobacteria bacterium]|nr:hypothetical protein [Acidobacteriota bacterium]